MIASERRRRDEIVRGGDRESAERGALVREHSLAAAYERWLPVAGPESTALLVLLVRATELEAHGSAEEQVAHAERLRVARGEATGRTRRGYGAHAERLRGAR